MSFLPGPQCCPSLIPLPKTSLGGSFTYYTNTNYGNANVTVSYSGIYSLDGLSQPFSDTCLNVTVPATAGYFGKNGRKAEYELNFDVPVNNVRIHLAGVLKKNFGKGVVFHTGRAREVANDRSSISLPSGACNGTIVGNNKVQFFVPTTSQNTEELCSAIIQISSPTDYVRLRIIVESHFFNDGTDEVNSKGLLTSLCTPLPITTTTTTVRPSQINVDDYCCKSTTTKRWKIQNTSGSSKNLFVRCGNTLSGTYQTLIIPAGFNDIVCFTATQGSIPSGLTITDLSSTGACFASEFEEVNINGQIWMKKNLAVTRFRNGDPIPFHPIRNNNDLSAWYRLRTPAYTYVGGSTDATKEDYGLLYNWYAVNDPRQLAPAGWHIPTYEEMRQLVEYAENLPLLLTGNDDGEAIPWVTNVYKYKKAGSRLKEFGDYEDAQGYWGWNEGNYGRSYRGYLSCNSDVFMIDGPDGRPVMAKTRPDNVTGFSARPTGVAPLFDVYNPLDCVTGEWVSGIPDTSGPRYIVDNCLHCVHREDVQSGNYIGADARCTDCQTIPGPANPRNLATADLNIRSMWSAYRKSSYGFENCILWTRSLKIDTIRYQVYGSIKTYPTALELFNNSPFANLGLSWNFVNNVTGQITPRIATPFVTEAQNAGFANGHGVRCIKDPGEDCTLISTTTTTTMDPNDGPCCNDVVGLPGPGRENFINNILVSASYTGPALPQGSLYFGPNCTGVTMPRNSVTLGNTPGSFSYVLTFSEPVNSIGINAFGGGPSVFGLIRERFVFNTNEGEPTLGLCALGTCYSDVINNVFVTGSTRLGGATIKVTAPAPFTELTISGEGGLRGTSFAICSFSGITTTTTTVPGTTTTTLCPKTSFTLTNTSPGSRGAVNYFADNSFINVLSVSVPYGQPVTICATRIIYNSPNVTVLNTEEICCETTTTTTLAPTTTTTTTCVIRTFTLTNTASNQQDVTYSVCGPIRALTLGGNETIQICASSIISSPPTIVITNEGTGCNTTTTTTTVAPTTTSTTTIRPCNTYGFTPILPIPIGTALQYTYIDCNGMIQTVSWINTTGQYDLFCAQSIVSNSPQIGSYILNSGSCITTTTTTPPPSTTTTSTSTTTTSTSTTTTTTTPPPCNTYQLVTSFLFDGMTSVVYINCNGVISNVFPGTPNNPVVICAQSIVSAAPIYQVTLLGSGACNSTTTTTTCAPVPGDGFTLISEITYNGGVSYSNLTASLTTACAARRNYINSANLGLPLIALRGESYLVDSITVGKTVYSVNSTTCGIPSGITGYYLLNDTLTSNRVVHVVNGVITEILSCNGQIECGTSFPEFTGLLKKDAYMNGQFSYNYSNQTSPALACLTCSLIEAGEPGLTVESIPGTIIYWDGDFEVGTILYKLSSAWQSLCPERYISLNGYFTHHYISNTGISDNGNTVYHIVSGEIVEIIDCATNCQRPSGMNTYSFSHSIGTEGGDPLDATPFTGSKLEACTALSDFTGGGLGFYSSNVQFESFAIGSVVYFGNESLSCQVVEDGWYIYNDSVIVHVVNGQIVEIVDNSLSSVPVQPEVIDVIPIDSVCPGRTYSYTIAAMPGGATSIYWQVAGGGTIVSGQGSLSITVAWPDGAVTGFVRAYGQREGSCYGPYRNSLVNLPSC